MLGTMARYGEHLPNGFITDLLEFRCVMFPPVVTLAITGAPDEIAGFLKRAERLPETSEAFAAYDWNLQLLMAASCGNPIYKLILNDFNALFKTMALKYFSTAIARNASRRYYRKLIRAIGGEGSNVETVVRRMMEQSIEIWKDQKKEQERYD